MNVITYTAARENLASTMDQVCMDRDPVIITRKREQAVVMISLEDYEALEETAYLLRDIACKIYCMIRKFYVLFLT